MYECLYCTTRKQNISRSSARDHAHCCSHGLKFDFDPFLPPGPPRSRPCFHANTPDTVFLSFPGPPNSDRREEEGRPLLASGRPLGRDTGGRPPLRLTRLPLTGGENAATVLLGRSPRALPAGRLLLTKRKTPAMAVLRRRRCPRRPPPLTRARLGSRRA